MVLELMHCVDDTANHQLPTAVASGSSESFPQRDVQASRKIGARSLLFSLIHGECEGHTVPVLMHWRLPCYQQYAGAGFSAYLPTLILYCISAFYFSSRRGGVCI